MRRLLPLQLLFLTLFPLTAATPIEEFYKQTFEETLKDSPEFATQIGRHEYDDRWSDWSVAGRASKHSHLQARLEKLKSFPEASLGAQDLVTVHLLKYDFGIRLQSDDLETHLLRVGQLFGFHNAVYILMDRMPARTVHDYENIIARLNAVPALVDQNIGIFQESISRGIMQPKPVVDLVIDQLTAQMKQDAAHTALLAPFRRFPSSLPQADQTRLLTAATQAYETRFQPAWRKLNEFITNQYAPKARAQASLGSLQAGHEAYAIMVRRLTTTNMTPREIHKLGEDEVQRIETAMQAAVAETGFKGSLTEFRKSLETAPEQHFKTKDEMLAYCRNIAKIIEPELPNQFRNIPMLLYGVRAIPPDREAATATNAQSPSPDFNTPGWFNLNTYQPEKQVKYDKEALVLHEAVPGHILQLTLAHALKDLPDIRKFYGNSAYIEGWALYSESLGPQLGLYKDPYSRFGQLSSELFRAVRLVVDTGMHDLGWTREQAIDYFHIHTTEETTAEIDRYISWPAQALSYKIGQLRIRQLRDQAEKRLGAKFDIREFHDVILRNGTLPLDLLSEQVEDYIRAAEGK